MADNHGRMNIEEHEKTYDAFITFMTRAAIAAVVFLIFLALAGA